MAYAELMIEGELTGPSCLLMPSLVGVCSAQASSAVGRGVHTRTVLLDDDSAGVGKSLVDLGVRQRTGVLVAAIDRALDEPFTLKLPVAR